jgi:hypothetical protein
MNRTGQAKPSKADLVWSGSVKSGIVEQIKVIADVVEQIEV